MCGKLRSVADTLLLRGAIEVKSKLHKGAASTVGNRVQEQTSPGHFRLPGSNLVVVPDLVGVAVALNDLFDDEASPQIQDARVLAEETARPKPGVTTAFGDIGSNRSDSAMSWPVAASRHRG